MAKEKNRLDLSRYLTREPITLALLTGLTVVLFLAVSGLAGIYNAQQASLANRWSIRGRADLNAARFKLAVVDFRTALLYSRGDFSFQLDLAEALVGLKRTDEAYAYLINLWDREPENGRVNLELARIAVENGQENQALRYYHDAIYATWPGDQETERQSTRLELIDFLLRHNARTQAESELIALAASVGSDPSLQTHLGELFMREQDYDRALTAYRMSLTANPKNQAAMAGAGLAAFDLGQYPMAQRYLEESVAAAPGDTESASLLDITRLVRQMDPFRRRISAADRNRIALEAFAAAGARLNSCTSPGGSTTQPELAQEWATLKPRMTDHDLRSDSDLVNTAMDLAFKIERQTSAACGQPSDTDSALLLIARLHEGN